MKYFFYLIALLGISIGFIACLLFNALYRWVLFPLYHLRFHSKPWAFLPEYWADYKREVEEFFSNDPIFYEGWEQGRTRYEQQRYIDRHTASWLDYQMKPKIKEVAELAVKLNS